MKPVANQLLPTAVLMSLIMLRGPSSWKAPPPFLQSDTHIGSITQWSEVRRAATHSWQRLTTRHMCTFTYSNAPLYCESCTHMLACTHACSACFITSIHSTVMVDHSWKIAHSKAHKWRKGFSQKCGSRSSFRKSYFKKN